MIKLTKTKTWDGIKHYDIGDTIATLSDDEEDRLVYDGVAEYAFSKEASQEFSSEDANQSDEDLPETEFEEVSSNVEDPKVVESDSESEIESETDTESETEQQPGPEQEEISIQFNPEEYVDSGNKKNKGRK